MFLFDRYAFHRDIVAYSQQPWTKKTPVRTELEYIDPLSLPADAKKSNLGPVPKNDPIAYVSYNYNFICQSVVYNDALVQRKRRAMRMQHPVAYYTVPPEHKNMNEHSMIPGSLVYANFTPYELIR